MKLKDIREGLRHRIREMISEGVTTGTDIARSVGAAQAHISNFLQGQRGISFDLADQLLEFAELEAEDLIASQELVARIPFEPMPLGSFVSVPVVGIENLMLPQLQRRHTESVILLADQLTAKSQTVSRRSKWTRLVAVNRTDNECLVIDRHFEIPDEGRFAVISGPLVEIGQWISVGKKYLFCPDDPSRCPYYAKTVIGRVLQIQTTL